LPLVPSLVAPPRVSAPVPVPLAPSSCPVLM
jgi:hypothetical protein